MTNWLKTMDDEVLDILLRDHTTGHHITWATRDYEHLGEGYQYGDEIMPESNQSVQEVVRDETLWCTQKAMALLFSVGVPAISKHLNHIFEEGELNPDVVVSKMEIASKIRKFKANEIYKR